MRISGAERVAVVVLNYNGGEETVECLRSLARLETPPGAVHVIDNASGDDSLARIRAACPRVEITANPGNLGFGRGHNALLERLLGEPFDWIWLLNNDARVRPDTLVRLLEHADGHPDAGVVGARIRESGRDGEAWTHGGGAVQRWLGRSYHLRRPVADARVDYITGACMLLRAEALRRAGLFDPGYFLYWEDVDLCWRLRRHGWRLTVAGEARVEHRASATVGAGSARQDRWLNASAVRFFRRHGPWGGWPAIVIGVGGRLLKRVAGGRWRAAAAVWRGAREGLRAA